MVLVEAVSLLTGQGQRAWWGRVGVGRRGLCVCYARSLKAGLRGRAWGSGGADSRVLEPALTGPLCIFLPNSEFSDVVLEA